MSPSYKAARTHRPNKHNRGDLGKGTCFEPPRLHYYMTDAQKRNMAKMDTMGVRGGGGEHSHTMAQQELESLFHCGV